MSLEHRTINCCHQGCYAIITLHPQEEKRLRDTHEWFYCPAGHQQHFTGKTEQEKKIDELERRAANFWKLIEDWRERWDAEHTTRGTLTHAIQVCPLGCGWAGRRRLPWQPDEEDVSRFLGRVGDDLADHLLAEHNATRAPVALLPEVAASARSQAGG